MGAHVDIPGVYILALPEYSLDIVIDRYVLESLFKIHTFGPEL
jgi:hypothetical protein